MTLIKCNECGKEISDKAQMCINCGCPIEKEMICAECGKTISKTDRVCKNCGCPIENKIDEKSNDVKTLTKTWLIICVFICFLISIFNYFDFFNFLGLSSGNLRVTIGSINIDVMGTLSLILGGCYIALFRNLSKKNFVLLLVLNALIFLYNLFSILSVMNLFYIICVLFNVIITFFIVKKELNNCGFNIKDYIPLFIILVISVIIPLVSSFNFNNDNSVLGTYVQYDGAEATLILLEDNRCSMSANKQDSEFPATITSCYWTIDDDIVTINFTMSMSNALGQVYTRDTTLTGTYDGSSITMSGGAVYYKR